jgi:signal transduction histidine kinase
MENWSTFAGFALFDLVVWPIPTLLYCLLPCKSGEATRKHAVSRTEQEIREAAGQEERNRLGQDLHDSVKQQIYSVQTHLAAAEAQLVDAADGARASIAHARKSARDAMAEMGALLDRLRDDPIESVGLAEALRRQCEALGFQTGATVSTTFGDLPSAPFLTSGAMTSVFRIAQEALANIARHARAKEVVVHCGISADRNSFVVEIHDDGCGFDAQSSAAGMGVRNMMLRADDVGAELEIKSRSGEGTVIRLRLPLIDAAHERTKQHVLGLIAALIPAIPAAVLMTVWEGAAPFMLPFVGFGGSLAGWHLLSLKRMKAA